MKLEKGVRLKKFNKTVTWTGYKVLVAEHLQVCDDIFMSEDGFEAEVLVQVPHLYYSIISAGDQRISEPFQTPDEGGMAHKFGFYFVVKSVQIEGKALFFNQILRTHLF